MWEGNDEKVTGKDLAEWEAAIDEYDRANGRSGDHPRRIQSTPTVLKEISGDVLERIKDGEL